MLPTFVSSAISCCISKKIMQSEDLVFACKKSVPIQPETGRLTNFVSEKREENVDNLTKVALC